MNVKYYDISASDAASMLKLDKTTVSGWCRSGKINFIDVSEPTSSQPRYMLKEEEVRYIKKLYQTYGKHEAMKHYDKQWYTTNPPKPVNLDIPVSTPEADKLLESTKATSLNAKKITDTIMYIQELKAKLEDLENEKRLLQEELESLRTEVLNVL